METIDTLLSPQSKISFEQGGDVKKIVPSVDFFPQTQIYTEDATNSLTFELPPDSIENSISSLIYLEDAIPDKAFYSEQPVAAINSIVNDNRTYNTQINVTAPPLVETILQPKNLIQETGQVDLSALTRLVTVHQKKIEVLEIIKTSILFCILIAVGVLIYKAHKIQVLLENASLSTIKDVYSTTDELRFFIKLDETNKDESTFLYNEYVYADDGSTFTDQGLSITPKVVDISSGKEYNVKFKITKESDTEYVLVGQKPEESLLPGRYQLQVDLSKGISRETKKQDFAWGVVALNTNKSMYTLGETATISIAVLDDKGSMVCDASVVLEITKPNKEIDILSTKDGTIVVNPGCHKKEMILKPDFEASYKLADLGKYDVKLTAETKNGPYSIQDSLVVADNIPYEVERTTATRIYPKVNYPVLITIKANQDYKGTITEEVPIKYKINTMTKEYIEETLGLKMNGSFTQNFSLSESENVKIITWKVDLKKGKTYDLAYEYDAPNRSPDFHILGPLRIGEFAELRYWQIAVDDIEILDVHSSPKEGENWVVRFETNGMQDLRIVPNDLVTINDDEFVSLTCDDEIMNPQILVGDIIYYPNWECDGQGIVKHKTLKARNHALRFEFGGDIKYAYNSTWLTDWNYRKSHIINSAPNSGTGYQFKIKVNFTGTGPDSAGNVYVDGKTQTDFDDIRFTTDDGTSPLDYWLESKTDSNNAIFVVEVAADLSTADRTIYLYYGNSSASSSSNGADTFLFFDDFSGDLSKWLVDSANTDKLAINSGALRHDPDTSQSRNAYGDSRVRTDSYKITDGIVEYSVYIGGSARIIHQFGWRVDSLNFLSGYCWRVQNQAADGGHLEFGGGSWAPFGTAFGAISGNTWHSVKEKISGSSYIGTVDGGSEYSGTDATKLTADYLVSHIHGVGMDANSYVLVDNVRVSKYVSPEPAQSTWGEEESSIIPDTSIEGIEFEGVNFD